MAKIEENIKPGLVETGCENMAVFIYLTIGPRGGLLYIWLWTFGLHIKGEAFLDKLDKYQVFK
jgi:hypothetical protein